LEDFRDVFSFENIKNMIEELKAHKDEIKMLKEELYSLKYGEK
jgi:hypothetical protein